MKMKTKKSTFWGCFEAFAKRGWSNGGLLETPRFRYDWRILSRLIFGYSRRSYKQFELKLWRKIHAEERIDLTSVRNLFRALNLTVFLAWVIIFWLFVITNWLSYFLYWFPLLFVAIFNINFKFCEPRIDFKVVTFWREKVREWNYRIYFSVNYRNLFHWEYSLKYCYLYNN